MKRAISITFAISLFLITACKKTPEALPDASFTVSTDIARPGETILFQNTSTGGKTFSWDFGDGSNSGEENPSHTYSETGEYVVHLEVTNSGGSDEASSGLTITLWTLGTSMATGRWGHAACVVEGKIYAIGGGVHYGHGALSSLEEYDPATDTWTTKSPMPTPRQYHASCVVDGKIYVTGGGESPSAMNYEGVECYATVEEYDPATDTWTEKSPMPTARMAHAACPVEGLVYAIGGTPSDSYPFTVNTSITTVEMYDPDTDTWTEAGTTPRPMVLCESVAIGGKIYVMGGDFENYGQMVDEYDPKTNTWTRKDDMFSTRSDFGCCVLNEKIYIMGGDQGYINIIVDFMEIYDPETDTWAIGTPMLSPTVGPSSCAVEGKIYAIGGLTNWHLPGVKKLEVYYE